jgi:hypothetical protein
MNINSNKKNNYYFNTKKNCNKKISDSNKLNNLFEVEKFLCNLKISFNCINFFKFFK